MLVLRKARWLQYVIHGIIVAARASRVRRLQPPRDRGLLPLLRLRGSRRAEIDEAEVDLLGEDCTLARIELGGGYEIDTQSSQETLGNRENP